MRHIPTIQLILATFITTQNLRDNVYLIPDSL